MINIRENEISVSNFNYLTDKVGWGVREENIVLEALNNTLYSVSIYDNEKIVGYGRIIGDKTIFLYIQDVMVIPEYQGRHIGTSIMNKLIDKVNEYKKINPSIRTYLGASKGREEFYKKFGFETRSDADLGEGMVLF